MDTITKKMPPMPKEKHWLMGHSKGMMKDMLSYLNEIQKECGDIAYLTAPVDTGKMYVLYNPDAIKHVLVDNHKNYIKGDYTNILKPLLGNGLITSEGSFWKKQRRLIQPVFYKDSILHMMKTVEECADSMVEKWDQTYKDGDMVDLTEEFNLFALRVVAKSLFKTDLEEDIHHISDKLSYLLFRIMNRFKNPIVYADWIPSQANKKEKNITRDLHAIIEKMISKKKSGDFPHQNDILDMLLAVKDEDTEEQMSEEQVRDELIAILIAGHETTALALSSMIYALTSNPEIYKKVDQYIDEHELTGAPEQIRGANYLRQVVSETLRLYPPAFFFQRQALKEDTINGYHVPAGMNISVPVFTYQRMAEYWDNPEAFDPDRFEEEAVKKRHKYAYVPFGGGPRLCIGEQFALSEMVIALIKIQKKFLFKPNHEYNYEFMPEMSLRTKDPIRLSIFRK